MPCTIETRNVTPEDKKKLFKIFYFFPPALLFFGGIFYFLFKDISLDAGDYPFIGVGLFVIAILFKIVWSYLVDYLTGKKQVITGTITDKKIHRSSSRHSGNRNSYYLYFDDKEIYVTDPRYYNMVQVNDKVEYHYTPKSMFSLQMKVLESNLKEEIEKLAAQSKSGGSNEPLPPEKPLSHGDIEKLKSAKYQGLLYKAIATLALLWIFHGFAILLGYFSYLIPSVYILMTAQKTRKRVNLHDRDIQYGYKIPQKLFIIDKHSSYWRGMSRFLKTGEGYISVPKDIYEKVTPGKEMIVYTGKYSNHLIDIE